jgi:peptidoglycan-N-acetylglucosamine deacetylase
LINALAVDVEHWWCNEYLNKYLPVKMEDQTTESIKPILDLLYKYKIKGTFFILGTVAEQHPEIIKLIFDAGHEIASHGYSHKMLSELDANEFEKEIIKSAKLLECITGLRPEGFRAPSFSLNNSTKWALEILVRHGFKYDASVFPVKTNLYGVPNAPLQPYKPSMDDITKIDPFGKIIEFPMTALKIGINLPVTGGFYLRSIPLLMQKFAIRNINHKRPIMLYIHPWETFPLTPRLKVPLIPKFIVYYGINSALKKLEALLKEFEFKPIRDVLKYN